MKENGFPERLKALLKQKQLTLAQVAKGIGTSAPSVHRWTRGGEIEYANLRALAGFLDVNWVWLRYGEGAINDLQHTLAANDAMPDLRREYLGQIMESEARMNLAQELAHIVTWEWNVLSSELAVSNNATAVFGTTLAEARPHLLPFEAWPLDDVLAQYAKPDLPLERDFSLRPGDGSAERWFASRSQLLFDAQHRPSRIVGVCIDITLRRQMRAALERSEYLMRKIIEIIPVGLWIADQSGRITTANPEAKRIWGGAKFVDLENYGEYKGRWESTGKEVGSNGWTLARAVREGEASRGEIVNIEAFDGEQRTIIMSAIPLLNADDNIVGAIEVNQDITELKRTERTLGASVENWRTVFEQPLVGIAYLTAQQPGLQANRRFCELLERSQQNLAEERNETLLDAETGGALSRHITSAAAGSPSSFEVQGRARSGNQFQLFCLYNGTHTGGIQTLLFAI